jgi:hypothetical protein
MKKVMILVSILSATFLLMSCAALERSSLIEDPSEKNTGAVEPNEVGGAAPIPSETTPAETVAENQSAMAPMPTEFGSTPAPTTPPPPPPATTARPGQLTLPPGTPLAPRTIVVTLIPPNKKEKVDELFVHRPPSFSKHNKIPPRKDNTLKFEGLKPGEKYYFNFGFTSTSRWLVNNIAVDEQYMYGRMLISINGQPPVEFTAANIVALDDAHRNMEVYIP